MGHTPYGYRIVDGKAVIDEAAATQIRELYQKYLSGFSLANAAEEVGLNLAHSGVKRIIKNRHYLGDDFYPAIIDKTIFDAAEVELKQRAEKLGRNNLYKAPEEKKIPTVFRLGDITENFDNPIRQAEYIYSLIESEVI